MRESYGTKNIRQARCQFLQYFTNDFLPAFPQDSLLSKQEAIKIRLFDCSVEVFESFDTDMSINNNLNKI